MYQQRCRWTIGVIILMLLIAACQRAEEKKTVASAPLREFLQEISVSTPVPTAMKAGETVTILVTVKNISKETWPASPDAKGLKYIALASRWLDKSGKGEIEGPRVLLPYDLESGKSVSLNASIVVPNQAGHLTLRLTMLQEGVVWFDVGGAKPLDTPVTVTAR